MATDLLFIDGLCIICGQDKRLCPGHQKKALVRKIRELMEENKELRDEDFADICGYSQNNAGQ